MALQKVAPRLPGTLIVLVSAIGASGLGLAGHGVDVVGTLPRALPDPALPSATWSEVLTLLPAAFGIMILPAEALRTWERLGASRYGA